MKDAMQSFLYGICAVGISAAVIGFCSAVKSLCRRYLSRGKSYDNK